MTWAPDPWMPKYHRKRWIQRHVQLRAPSLEIFADTHHGIDFNLELVQFSLCCKRARILRSIVGQMPLAIIHWAHSYRPHEHWHSSIRKALAHHLCPIT
jgi:hypothetical protein